uniref:Uncharacterized protein n=1 Tax=Cannabis sativa TaxID=3483 RepID=A0A803P3K2_CANSA
MNSSVGGALPTIVAIAFVCVTNELLISKNDGLLFVFVLLITFTHNGYIVKSGSFNFSCEVTRINGGFPPGLVSFRLSFWVDRSKLETVRFLVRAAEGLEEDI